MTTYQIIENIMKSNKLTDGDKVYYIQSFLLHFYTKDDIKWIWED